MTIWHDVHDIFSDETFVSSGAYCAFRINCFYFNLILNN